LHGLILPLALVVLTLAAPVSASAQEDAQPKANKTQETSAKRTKAKATRSSEELATTQNITLIAGSQSTYDLPFEPCKVKGSYEECIKVTDKQKVSLLYSEDKHQLMFTPLKEGETNITVRDKGGDIRLILRLVINSRNLQRRLDELKELLRDIEGIELKIMSDKIVVDGEVVVIGDLNRLYAVLSDPEYKDLILNLVTVSPVGMQILAEKIQAEINNPNVKVRVLNGLFVLEGQVDTGAEANRAIDVAHTMVAGFALPTYNFQGAINPIDVKRQTLKDPIIVRLTIAPPKPPAAPKMVRITIDFVELSKDYLTNFGFSWMPNLDANSGSITFGQSTTGGVTTSGNGSLAGTITNLFPRLSNAQNAGYARVLEETVMLVKSADEARIERMLDVPIQTVNDKGQPVFTSVKLGPAMKVIPKITTGEDIDVKINFSYSGLAGKQGTVPIALNHKYETQVVIKSGESAAIVNAISNAISTAFNKDPPQGVVPQSPMFELLRSKSFQKNKSQFVVFVTPQIIESMSSGTEDIKKRYGIKRKQ